MSNSLRNRQKCESSRWWFPAVVMALLLLLAGCTTSPEYVDVSIVRGDQTIATYKAELAVTPEERALGLSGRLVLKEGHGMLFIFPAPGFYSMWMPDMQFPVDILFIDEDQTVIGIAENVPPCSYRDDCPSVFGGYVLYALEIPAGSAARHGITHGDRMVY